MQSDPQKTKLCSSQQAMFTSAQDVSIERSMFDIAGQGGVNVTVHQHESSPVKRENKDEDINFQAASVVREGPVPTPELDEKQFKFHAGATISDGPDHFGPRIYREQLLRKKRGIPLWQPGPNRKLPTVYRLRGLSIGDVGILNELGGFTFLFNIFEKANSKINRGRVPAGFQSLTWISEQTEQDGNTDIDGIDVDDVKEHAVYGPGSWLGSEAIEAIIDSGATGGLTFQTCATEGAILAMPRGATSQDLGDHLLEDYMIANLEAWYIDANRTRRLKVKNGDIRLVYGCDKVSSWGIATFKRDSVSGTIRGSEQKAMQFKPTGSAHNSDSTSFTWTYVDGGDGRVGPSDDDLKSLKPDPDDEAWLQPPGRDTIDNQCVFVRAFNAKLAPDQWLNIMGDETESAGDKMSRSEEQGNSSGCGSGGRPPNERRSRSSSSSTGSLGSSSSGSSGHNAQHLATDGLPLTLIHPADTLNDSLLRQYPGAKMVITADADWLSVLDRFTEVSGLTDTTELLKLGIQSFHIERLMRDSHEVLVTEGIIRIRRLATNAAVQRVCNDNTSGSTEVRRQSVTEHGGTGTVDRHINLVNSYPSPRTNPLGGTFRDSTEQTCLGCGTTSTPEWRRGPLGPRTLCNACGLVYAKMMNKRGKREPLPQESQQQS